VTHVFLFGLRRITFDVDVHTELREAWRWRDIELHEEVRILLPFPAVKMQVIHVRRPIPLVCHVLLGLGWSDRMAT